PGGAPGPDRQHRGAAAAAAGLAAHALEQRCRLREVLPRAASWTLPHGRRGLSGRRRLPLHHEPRGRHHQRGGASPLHRRDGGGALRASRHRRVRGGGGGRRDQGRDPDGLRRHQGGRHARRGRDHPGAGGDGARAHRPRGLLQGGDAGQAPPQDPLGQDPSRHREAHRRWRGLHRACHHRRSGDPGRVHRLPEGPGLPEEGIVTVRDLVLAILAVALAGCAAPTAAPSGPIAAGAVAGAGPRFAVGGHDAEGYGAREGYPVKIISRPPFLVGAFSHYDQFFESRVVRRAATPSRLSRAAAEPLLRYRAGVTTHTLDDYIARNPAPGLLIARGDTILVERYQYARNDRHRFTSFSMAKTVTAMLIGVAIAEGHIRSVDDLAAAYVPAPADTEYGRTSLRHLLQMSSGVHFSENYSGADDASRLFIETVFQDGAGGVAAVKPYNQRDW